MNLCVKLTHVAVYGTGDKMKLCEIVDADFAHKLRAASDTFKNLVNNALLYG